MSESPKRRPWIPSFFKKYMIKPIAGHDGEDPWWVNPFEQLRRLLSDISVPSQIKGVLEALPKLPENIFIALRQLIYINIVVTINNPVKDKSGELADHNVIPSLEAAKKAMEEFSDALAILQAKGGKMYITEPAAAATAETFLTTEKEKAYQKLKREYKLLAAPNIVLRVVELARNPDIGALSMVEVVEQDPAIAARVLQYANSPFSGTRHRFDSLQGAVVHLGFERMIGLALDVSMRSRKMPRCPGFDYDLFWNRSSAAAAAARQVAPMFGSEIKPVVAFTAGLLGRIGELAYASTFPEEYSTYLRSTTGGPEETTTQTLSASVPPAIYESKKIALTPVELSARLLADWKMPFCMYSAVLCPDDLSRSDVGGKTAENTMGEEDRETAVMVRILRWAYGMADILTAPPDLTENWLKPHTDDLVRQLGSGEAQFASAFNGSINDWKVFGRLLNVHTRDVQPWPEILGT